MMKEHGYARMEYEIHNFIDDLEKAVHTDLVLNADFDNIIICGMGGSAIGGDIITDFVRKEVKCPIVVQRFPELPKWVNERTFAIIISYSGNTSETISMYKQAIERNCPRIVMMVGGELERMAIEQGDPMIKLDPGFQPRSALGMILGNLTCVIDCLCKTECRKEIIRLMPSLRKMRADLMKEKGMAMKVAIEIGNKIPIIYAISDIYASAIRWKTQINENSKMMAFAGSVPEFNHNEIMGWSQGELRDKCVIVFLYEANASKETRKMADASIDMMKKYKQDIIVIRIDGDSTLERAICAIMTGDYTSLYLAKIRNTDPEDTTSIEEFKNRFHENYDGYHEDDAS